MLKQILEEIGINIGISVAGLFGSLLLIGKTATINLKTTFIYGKSLNFLNYLTTLNY